MYKNELEVKRNAEDKVVGYTCRKLLESAVTWLESGVLTKPKLDQPHTGN